MKNRIKKFVWEKRNNDYDMMTLWSVGSFDCFLIRYNEGSRIEPHRDPPPSGSKHFRLNIILKHAKAGGQFVSETTIFSTDRIKFFRPDISTHSVTKIESGTRYVLSMGWTR